MKFSRMTTALVSMVLLSGVLPVGAMQAVAADDAGTGFVERVYRGAAGEHRYAVFVPANQDASRKWPVILFLQGAGERGRDAPTGHRVVHLECVDLLGGKQLAQRTRDGDAVQPLIWTVLQSILPAVLLTSAEARLTEAGRGEWP